MVSQLPYYNSLKLSNPAIIRRESTGIHAIVYKSENTKISVIIRMLITAKISVVFRMFNLGDERIIIDVRHLGI